MEPKSKLYLARLADESGKEERKRKLESGRQREAAGGDFSLMAKVTVNRVVQVKVTMQPGCPLFHAHIK